MAAQLDSDETARVVLNDKRKASVVNRHRFYSVYAKRWMDIVFSIFGLLVCAVPMSVVAILIRLTSPGPILYCQLRGGRNGKFFVLYKFRSMYIDAPERSNQEFSVKAMKHYVTPLGKILRRTSIDELPQLVNVLRGEMSFIGPRPLAKTDQEVLQLRAKNGAEQIRPGITGLAQVYGRNSISNTVKAEYDKEYAENLSIFQDMLIVLCTIKSVFLQSNLNRHDGGNNEKN